MKIDDREIEQGYANFHRNLNRILRTRDVKSFQAHIAAFPQQAGKLSHCLGLSDELAEIEMYKAIVLRSPLKDLHAEARTWLKERGVPVPASTSGRKGRKTRRKGSKK